MVLDIIDAEKEEPRKVWVFDSFQGLPPSKMTGDKTGMAANVAWEKMTYLRVPLDAVQNNFRAYGLDADDKNKVEFVKGFFNDTMPLVFNDKLDLKALSVLRMDGDMYESTVDILFNAFHKLSVNGVIIVDDWFGFPAQTAVKDFFKWHGVPMPEIIKVDDLSVYFVKGVEWEGVPIKREKYQELVAEKK